VAISPPLPPGTTLVLYDGVCGLCDWLVRFILSRDTNGRFRFAALQNDAARGALAAHGLDPGDLSTVYVIADWRSTNERALARSRAVLYSLTQVGGGWGLLGRVGSMIPASLADIAYRGVARVRYRIFGRFDTCVVPPPEVRRRFLDQSADP
jgi:predicted DCC family thiol-disulfide oxidoreductase YuxK